jgi:hypothetical protein
MDGLRENHQFRFGEAWWGCKPQAADTLRWAVKGRSAPITVFLDTKHY